MSIFCCPVCREDLVKKEKSLVCQNGHCFDLSKKGYVNLLMSQKTKNHGDDKLMVNARRDFLNKGYYKPLLDNICTLLGKYAESGNVIFDSGCGEGWYTANICDYLQQQEIDVTVCGVDVSKDALNAAAARSKLPQYAVASVFDVPMKDESSDIIMSLFAPFSRDEFLRLLKSNGLFITVFPLENHLFGLKQAVYDNPYKNEVADLAVEGFECIETKELKYTICLECNADIKSLFSMTPYYYKTGAADQKKLDLIDTLETAVEFCIAVYKKNR